MASELRAARHKGQLRDMIDIIAIHQALLVLDHQSIRRAAAIVGIRPSAVSRRLQSLEGKLGFQLFHRRSVGTQPTDAGRLFLEKARQAIADLDDAVSVAGLVQSAQVEMLDVAFYPSIISGHLGHLLREHRTRFPEVQFRFHESAPIDQLSRLERQHVDVAFVVEVWDVPGINSETLWQEKIRLALPEHHRLAKREPLVWEDIRNETVVMQTVASGSWLHEWLLNQTETHGFVPKLHQHNVSREGLLGLVSAGYGVAVVLESVAALSVPGVVYRSVPGERDAISIRMVWLAVNDNPSLGRFLSHARRVSRRCKEGSPSDIASHTDLGETKFSVLKCEFHAGT